MYYGANSTFSNYTQTNEDASSRNFENSKERRESLQTDYKNNASRINQMNKKLNDQHKSKDKENYISFEDINNNYDNKNKNNFENDFATRKLRKQLIFNLNSLQKLTT